MTPADLEVLRADRWFGAIPASRQALLLRRGRVQALPGGARIYALGDPPDGLKAVVEGEIRLISSPAPGQEATALIMGPGAWFGGLAAVDGGVQAYEAVAYGPVRVLHLSQAAFEQATADDPMLYRDMALLIAGFQRASLSMLSQTLAQPITVRLARLLAGAVRSSGSQTLRVRQEDLAAMIGVTRQTINKTLKALERQGMIAVSYRHLVVLNPERLRALGRPKAGEF